MAWNATSSNAIKTTAATNYQIAKKVLPVFDKLDMQTGKRFGWIPMDYFTHTEVIKIVSSNMGVVDYELKITFDADVPMCKPEELTYTLYAIDQRGNKHAVYTQKECEPVKEGDHYKVTFPKLPAYVDKITDQYPWTVEITAPGLPEYDSYAISRT